LIVAIIVVVVAVVVVVVLRLWSTLFKLMSIVSKRKSTIVM
jgi:hypothetical protein